MNGNLDRHATLKQHSILNRKAEPARRRLGRCRGLAISLLIAFSICFLKDYSVAANYTTNHYRQYAFIQLNSLDEFYCIDELWHKESRWQPNAKNPKSSAYGIPQILGMKEKNGMKQVLIGLKYVKHRYDTPCKALAHHKLKGWY